MPAPDWRSYDDIAAAYERLWAVHLVRVAEHLLDLCPAVDGRRALDVGTGTGAVLAALVGGGRRPARVAACDLSPGMLARVRRRWPQVVAAVADARALPFLDRSFDLVTASFVLSHLADYAAALAEMQHVLAAGGALAVSSWGDTASCHYDAAFSDILAAHAGETVAQEALAVLVPAEAELATPERLAAALSGAGLRRVVSRSVDVGFAFAREDYLAARELTGASRLARHRLGEAGWQHFQRRVREVFAARFEPTLRYTRPVNVAAGLRP